MVRAEAQAAAVRKIVPLLTDEEEAVYRRGRNAQVHSIPKTPARASTPRPLPWRRCWAGSIYRGGWSGSMSCLASFWTKAMKRTRKVEVIECPWTQPVWQRWYRSAARRWKRRELIRFFNRPGMRLFYCCGAVREMKAAADRESFPPTHPADEGKPGEPGQSTHVLHASAQASDRRAHPVPDPAAHGADGGSGNRDPERARGPGDLSSDSEAMGRRSNLILTGPDNRIIDCIRRIDGDLSQQLRCCPECFTGSRPSRRIGTTLWRRTRRSWVSCWIRPRRSRIWTGGCWTTLPGFRRCSAGSWSIKSPAPLIPGCVRCLTPGKATS